MYLPTQISCARGLPAAAASSSFCQICALHNLSLEIICTIFLTLPGRTEFNKFTIFPGYLRYGGRGERAKIVFHAAAADAAL